MTATKTFTLIFALSLLSLVFPVAYSHVDTPSARRNVPSVHRMLKKRVPPLLGGAVGINNAAGADPQTPNRNGPPAGPDITIATPTQTVSLTDTAKVQTDTTGTPLIPITPIPTASLHLPSSALTTNTSSTLSVSPTTTPSSSSTPSVTSTPLSTDTSTTPPSITQITVTSSSTQTPTPTASTSGKSVTTIQRNTIIILIAIGGSIGAAGLIWTVIRKWKFRPSSSFEDRMQPIDWQPTTTAGGEHDMAQRLGRSATVRSHGSFTSGNDHDNHLVADIPSHDFTAGAAHLAPGAGYADLQRGPSPQPDYGQYRYDIPNPQHGGGAYNNAGGYQGGGYDHNRGY